MPRTAAERSPAHVVAVVGSAGGIGALEVLFKSLPSDLHAAVLVVIHLTPQAPSVLPAILGRWSALPVEQAEDGMPIEVGIVRVAPPDAHMLVDENGLLRLDQSELVHHVRPSADVLLLSLAQNHRGSCTASSFRGPASTAPPVRPP